MFQESGDGQIIDPAEEFDGRFARTNFQSFIRTILIDKVAIDCTPMEELCFHADEARSEMVTAVYGHQDWSFAPASWIVGAKLL